LTSMRPFNRLSLGSLTAVTMAAATFAQVVFSALSSNLIDEFGVERWQIGALVTATGVTGALLSPVFGRVTDRLGAVRSMRSVLVAAVVFLGLIALAPTYGFLALAAVLTGVPQGWCNPATNALIVSNVEAGARGIITGIKQSGVQMGTFLGGLVMAPISQVWGWRPALAVFLIFPLAGLIGMRRRPDVQLAPKDTRSTGPLPVAVTWVAAYGTVSGLATSAVFTFMPLFAQEDQGWSAAQAGLLLAGIGLVGVVSRISWGSASERWLGHGSTLRLLAIQASTSSLLLALAALDFLPGWALVPAAILFGSGAIAWNAVGMLAVMDFSPSQMVGRGTGLVLLGFLLGIGFGAPIMGLSVDRLGTYVPGWTVVTLLFLTCVLIAGRITRTGTLAHT
jgi:predicted MFS family arabinose efflux permease